MRIEYLFLTVIVLLLVYNIFNFIRKLLYLKYDAHFDIYHSLVRNEYSIFESDHAKHIMHCKNLYNTCNKLIKNKKSLQQLAKDIYNYDCVYSVKHIYRVKKINWYTNYIVIKYKYNHTTVLYLYICHNMSKNVFFTAMGIRDT